MGVQVLSKTRVFRLRKICIIRPKQADFGAFVEQGHRNCVERRAMSPRLFQNSGNEVAAQLTMAHLVIGIFIGHRLTNRAQRLSNQRLRWEHDGALHDDDEAFSTIKNAISQLHQAPDFYRLNKMQSPK